jgi:excisionase family DNA binding protein
MPIRPQRASRGWRAQSQGETAEHAVPAAPELGEPWLLDSHAVARLLGIGRTKTFQLMASGQLPVVRIGRCARVPRSALASWIADRTGEALPLMDIP